jgi:DNA-binding PadR family transcriptional regulator
MSGHFKEPNTTNWAGHWGGHRDWGRGRGHRRGPGGHWGGEFGRGFFGHHGRHRERLERGLMRHVILSVLEDGPKHGYEIIKQVEERTQGNYSPSPGTLYPTLQYLADLGLIQAEEQEGRRVAYTLTDSGRAELDKQHGPLEHFWSRFPSEPGSRAARQEVSFLQDALKDLNRTVAVGMREAMMAGDTSTIRELRLVLERTQNEIRELITQRATDRPSAEEPEGASTPVEGSDVTQL